MEALRGVLWSPYENLQHGVFDGTVEMPSGCHHFRPYGRDPIFFPNRDSYFSGDSTIRPRGGVQVTYNPVVVTVDPRST